MITLATLAQATAQEVFDQVAVHLLTQLEKSTRNGNCVYRSPEGLKCAAGCLISDEEYSSRMDNEGSANSWVQLTRRGLVPFTVHDTLVSNLQLIHDGTFSGRWKGDLVRLAESLNLSTKAIDKM